MLNGTGVGRLYSDIRQHMGRFSNVVLGTRSFTEGNIEGHQGTMIFYRRVFAKAPMLEGHDYFLKGDKVRLP